MPTKKRIQYRYTPTGQRSLLIDPDGGRFTYSYDSVKRLTQVLNPQGQRTTFGYDNAGRRTVKRLASGSRTSFSYDLASRLTSVAQLKSDASVQAQYQYKYDKVGNRTAMAESGHTTARTTWSYDAAYQLTGEHRTGANPYRNTYTYDTRGNRTLKNLDGVRTTSSYDAANQLKWTDDGSGRTTYTFDPDGNQQVVLTPAGQRTTSVWDYENKLTGVLYPSVARETMAYDPGGKRVKHQTASETSKYVWDQENYLQETNASDVTQAVFTNEPRTYGNLISQRRSGATHYYVFDALGSTRLLTDSLEAISESLLYDAWGNLVGSSPSMAVLFRWVGELGYLFVPASGDYYVRARVYRPTVGRWISVDPLGFVDGANRFRYVLNQPSVAHDPRGLQYASPPSGPWGLPPGWYTPPWHEDLGDSEELQEECQQWCGPDISDWFQEELQIISDWATVVRAGIAIEATRMARRKLWWFQGDAEWALKVELMKHIGGQFEYRDIRFSAGCCPSEDCTYTVTLGGLCVHNSELGNLVYAFTAAELGLDSWTIWAGGAFGGAGRQTIQDYTAIQLGSRYSLRGRFRNGQTIGDYIAARPSRTKRELGKGAPRQCIPCDDSVDPGASHIDLPWGTRPLTVAGHIEFDDYVFFATVSFSEADIQMPTTVGSPDCD